jgi:aryl carrier-like protein
MMSEHDLVMASMIEMVTDVLDGAVLDPIEPGTAFRDGLGFDSIRFIALAELIQNRWDRIDFVTWLQAKPLTAIMALTVGEVADFVVAETTAPR